MTGRKIIHKTSMRAFISASLRTGPEAIKFGIFESPNVLTESASFLGGQAGEGAHTAEGGGEVRHLVDVRVVARHGQCTVATYERSGRQPEKPVVLWCVSCNPFGLQCLHVG